MRASFLALLLPLCSAAPAPFDKKDAKHGHDGNVTRKDKIFDNSQINMGDLTVDAATGDNMQIGHMLDINVVQSHEVKTAKEMAPAHKHDGVVFEERLRRLFKSIDSDEDGIISVTELNNIYITELEAERVLTLPEETVPFTLSYFIEILDNSAASSDTADLLHFLLQSVGSKDHLMFDKNLMQVFLALDADHNCRLFVPDILAVFQDLGKPITLDEAKSLLSGYHGHNHHDGVDFDLWKKLILGEVFKQDEHLVNFWRDAFIEVKKSLNTGKGVLPVEGEGKPWCKGGEDGQECCESDDPEGSKCIEGQGDCDSDEGCSGDLICGRNNCKKYNPMADPEDDCCMPKFDKGVVPVEGEGKPWCKGRNFPDGQECCEPDDPEGSKCVEGQGDCDSDEGCSGDLVCGRENCIKYNPMADPEDDCCMSLFVGDVMRTNVENAAKMAVKALKHGPELGECYKGELLKVESASVEVKEGLQYKLQLRISTMGGEDCMESMEMVCENIFMTKPLPKDCKGTDALKLINREHITCQQKVGKVGFEACVDEWCLQDGTDEQYTRCEEATDGGDTCINPLIKYGTTEGGIPIDDYDGYNDWCKMIFHEERTGSVTQGKRDCSAPKGYVYWCEGSEEDGYETDEDGYKWCDVDGDGKWKDGSLDSGHSEDECWISITSISCTTGENGLL